jgi:lipid-binding SYLF domain-containing protein
MKIISTYLVAAMMIAGFTTSLVAGDNKQEDNADLTVQVNEAKAAFLKQDEGLKSMFDKAAGCVIFPSVGKGAVGIGGARGTGQVFDKDKLVGEATLTQFTVGFQFGGQVYSELIFFEDKTSLDNFKKGNMEFSAQVSAVAATAGASKNAKYEKGVMVFTMAKGGLMYEASVGGQKFAYEAY